MDDRMSLEGIEQIKPPFSGASSNLPLVKIPRIKHNIYFSYSHLARERRNIWVVPIPLPP
jgi:hypothetical protein